MRTNGFSVLKSLFWFVSHAIDSTNDAESCGFDGRRYMYDVLIDNILKQGSVAVLFFTYRVISVLPTVSS